MLKAIFNWFSNKNPSPQSQAPVVQPEAAPYKVEAPVVIKPVAEAAPVAAIKAASKKPVAKKPAAPAKPAPKKSPKKST